MKHIGFGAAGFVVLLAFAACSRTTPPPSTSGPFSPRLDSGVKGNGGGGEQVVGGQARGVGRITTTPAR